MNVYFEESTMSNLIFTGQKNKHLVTSGFAETRNYEPYNGKGHEGIDYKDKKGTSIYCEINGLVEDISYQQNVYGHRILVKTNLGYLTKELEGCIIYHIYGHLFKVDNNIKIKKFVKAGQKIGQMGNSGFCMYQNSSGELVKVTEEQAKDSKFESGVHLHLSFYTGLKNTYLIDLIKQKLNLNNNDFYLNQWGRYYLHPDYFFKFLGMY